MSLTPSGHGDAAVPLVTVAMPVFNAGRHLKLAVLSIVAQTFRDWELLVIDDGSTDNALQDIASIQDSRIRVLRDGSNRGLAARLNEAIDLARGRYFARMDQDDVAFPERFERQLKLLQDDPRIDLTAVRAITISDENEIVGLLPCPLTHEAICARPWQGFGLPHPVWMGTTAWFRKYRYAIPGPFFCEDQELLLRSYRQSRFCAVDEVLFAYRLRKTSSFRKVLKTRLTLTRLQFSHFIRSAQPHLAALSLGALLALVTCDLWRAIRQLQKLPQYTTGVVEARLVNTWNAVLAELGRKR